jgi:hypothetical protein
VKLPPDAYIDPRKITDYLLRLLEDSYKISKYHLACL